MNNLNIIIGREVKERVAKKSFIFTTLLTPLFMILLMALPSLIMLFSHGSKQKIVTIDKSELVLPALLKEAQDNELVAIVPAKSGATQQELIHDENYDGVLVIGPDIVSNPSNVTLYSRESSTMDVKDAVSSTVAEVVREQRMKKYNVEDIDRLLADSRVSVDIKEVRVDEEGNESDSSCTLAMALGFIMTFMLYTFLLLYGQMVMNSIIEEKNNRVLELMVSSVKPIQLMLGKIIGVGLVALIQIVVWAILVCAFVAMVMPLLIPADIATDMAAMQAGTFNAASSDVSTEMLTAISTFSNVGYVASIFGYLALLMVGGFLFYASIFAAIGASVDNAQDASNLTTFATIPIIFGLVFGMMAFQDPNSTAVIWMSMIPFTSPMVMIARIPFDIAQWQIWISFAILIASFVGMAWFAGKVYRIGIFMYGKKPTVKDIIRWARYK